MVLDGSGQKSVTKVDLDMPPEPTLIFSDELEKRVQKPAKEHTQSPTSIASKQEARPDLKKNIVSEIRVPQDIDPGLLSWVVQVGAFGEEQKAVALEQMLAEAGYDAVIEKTSGNGKSVYRVKVGPVISQDAASKLQARLRNELKLESTFITRHPRVNP